MCRVSYSGHKGRRRRREKEWFVSWHLGKLFFVRNNLYLFLTQTSGRGTPAKRSRGSRGVWQMTVDWPARRLQPWPCARLDWGVDIMWGWQMQLSSSVSLSDLHYLICGLNLLDWLFGFYYLFIQQTADRLAVDIWDWFHYHSSGSGTRLSTSVFCPYIMCKSFSFPACQLVLTTIVS